MTASVEPECESSAGRPLSLARRPGLAERPERNPSSFLAAFHGRRQQFYKYDLEMARNGQKDACPRSRERRGDAAILAKDSCPSARYPSADSTAFSNTMNVGIQPDPIGSDRPSRSFFNLQLSADIIS